MQHIRTFVTAATIVAAFFLFIATAARSQRFPPPPRLRAIVYRTHHCLAEIVDREDPSWDPTISWHGGHNINDSYGLGQANPGWKMAAFGRDWRTNPWTQLRWMRAYAVGRYGSECAALGFWLGHSWW